MFEHDPRGENWHTGWRHSVPLVGFVGLCLLAGAVGGSITAAEIPGWYATLVAPPGRPPNWVFAPVWTTLYVMMGISAWLVWREPGSRQVPALRLWGWQLLCNALWAPAFFGLHSPVLALGVIAVLLVLIGLTIRAFARMHRLAAGLLVPYAAWSCYAAYLNVGFVWLNW